MARLTILLGTLNGARFLPQQLASYENQSFKDWRLLVSDDGSSDATGSILAEFGRRSEPDRLVLRNGPARGFVRNFLSLACEAAPPTEFYAFSDQDDIWEPDKLSRALAWLQQVPAGTPALYCGRTRLIDAADRPVGFSPLFGRQPSFRNALVQSIAGGNTMVFNEAARRLATILGSEVAVPSHDWWFYLLVTGVGGSVHYDPVPTTRYRVHHRNLVGSNIGWAARSRRIRMLASGRFKGWTDLHVAALTEFRPHLTPAHRDIFDAFSAARQSRVAGRLLGIARSGVYRQTFLGNAGLVIAALLKKI